jgi:hypothetical protein
MKLHEILNEAVDSPREQIRQTLEDNKELLQKQRSRIGITRVLTKIFPGVNFRMFKLRRKLGAAYYHPRTREITVGNVAKMMTRKTVRHKWDGFVDAMLELLTHENIHKEQAKRRNYLFKDLPDPSPELRTELKAKYHALALKHKHASGDEKKKLEIKIQQLINKSRAQGVALPLEYDTWSRDYLSDKDEITAYAEQIAYDLVRVFELHTELPREAAKEAAIASLKNKEWSDLSAVLNRYKRVFTDDSKTLKRVLKQVVHFIEQM